MDVAIKRIFSYRNLLSREFRHPRDSAVEGISLFFAVEGDFAGVALRGHSAHREAWTRLGSCKRLSVSTLADHLIVPCASTKRCTRFLTSIEERKDGKLMDEITSENPKLKTQNVKLFISIA